MLKSHGDKNRKKKSIGLISKNNNFARAVHFFCTFLCRCCCNVELLVARFTKKMSYIKSHDRSHYGSCVHVCTHEKKLLVFLMSLSFFLFFFFFSLPLSFTLLAANISHFPTAGIKVSCCSSNQIISLQISVSLFPVELRQSVAPTFSFSLSIL